MWIPSRSLVREPMAATIPRTGGAGFDFDAPACDAAPARARNGRTTRTRDASAGRPTPRPVSWARPSTREQTGPDQRPPRAAWLAVLLCAALAGCGPPPAASSITLATTLPLSSGESAIARAWQRGYQRAVDEANRAGGLVLAATGRHARVVLHVVDDGGELARAEAAVEDLVARGVHALLATPGPVRMVAQAAAAGRHACPYVVPTGAAPDLLATEHPWVFATREAGRDEEDTAYRTARAALDVLTRAPNLEPEALRRAFATSMLHGVQRLPAGDGTGQPDR